MNLANYIFDPNSNWKATVIYLAKESRQWSAICAMCRLKLLAIYYSTERSNDLWKLDIFLYFCQFQFSLHKPLSKAKNIRSKLLVTEWL